MDRLDKKILRLLQEDATLAVADIAKRVGLSTTPCWRRIRRMQEDGVIRGRAYQFDPKAVGPGITVITMTKLDRHDEAALDAFEREAEKLAEIVECYLVTGTYDYALKIVTRDMDAFETFLKTRLSNLPHVGDMHSTVVMRRVKDGGRLPI